MLSKTPNFVREMKGKVYYYLYESELWVHTVTTKQYVRSFSWILKHFNDDWSKHAMKWNILENKLTQKMYWLQTVMTKKLTIMVMVLNWQLLTFDNDKRFHCLLYWITLKIVTKTIKSP